MKICIEFQVTTFQFRFSLIFAFMSALLLINDVARVDRKKYVYEVLCALLDRLGSVARYNIEIDMMRPDTSQWLITHISQYHPLEKIKSLLLFPVMILQTYYHFLQQKDDQLTPVFAHCGLGTAVVTMGRLAPCITPIEISHYGKTSKLKRLYQIPSLYISYQDFFLILSLKSKFELRPNDFLKPSLSSIVINTPKMKSTFIRF